MIPSGQQPQGQAELGISWWTGPGCGTVQIGNLDLVDTTTDIGVWVGLQGEALSPAVTETARVHLGIWRFNDGSQEIFTVLYDDAVLTVPEPSRMMMFAAATATLVLLAWRFPSRRALLSDAVG